MTDLWLIAESQDKLRELWAEAERDRLARELRRPGRPARAALAGALRALASRLDSPAASRNEQLAAAR